MRDFEKMAFGTTYGEAYSRPSRVVHYGKAHRGTVVGDVNLMRVEATQLQFRMLCVVARVFELLGNPNVPAAAEIHQILAGNTEASRFAGSATKQSVVEGDFVVVHGFLAEVVAATTSPGTPMPRESGVSRGSPASG